MTRRMADLLLLILGNKGCRCRDFMTRRDMGVLTHLKKRGFVWTFVDPNGHTRILA